MRNILEMAFHYHEQKPMQACHLRPIEEGCWLLFAEYVKSSALNVLKDRLTCINDDQQDSKGDSASFAASDLIKQLHSWPISIHD